MNSTNKKLKSGFTFIEVLVSVTIIIVIATVSIGYGNSVRSQLALTRTQSQLVSMFNHAKSLSQNFLFTPPPGKRICAYGVHVDRTFREFIVFNDLIDEGEDCDDEDNGANHKYDGISEALSGQINSFKLDTEVLELISSPDRLDDVVFVPPIPEVIINGNEIIESGSVIIRVKDPSQSARFELKVNQFGQINIE